VKEEYGQHIARGHGTIVTLTAGQHLKDISFRLVPAGVIAGHVYDEDGEPVADAEVQALQLRYWKGERKLAQLGATQTNDLGEYRLRGLDPGRYYVSASDNPDPNRDELPEGGYETVYYPGGSDPGRASLLELHPGEELPGIDFTFVPIKTFSVRGRV